MLDAFRVNPTIFVVSTVAISLTWNAAHGEEQISSPLRMLSFDQEKVADVQGSPSCKSGLCPGLGNSFYLPGINALSVNTGGRIFLINRKLGECAVLSEIASNTRKFKTANSMQQFIKQSMSEADLAGNYKTATLTASGTAQSMTGQSSKTTTTFNSSNLDITIETRAVDIQQNKECFGSDNIHPDFLKGFESLALIDSKTVGSASSWAPYVQFLQDQGSHIVMQQILGSRFQRWESSTSQASDIQHTLQAKACAEVEGITPGSGWSVKACAAYTEDEKRQALKAETASQDIIRGGTTDTRNALSKDRNKETIDAFIDSAQQADQAIQLIFKPIWDVLVSIYTPQCATDGTDSAPCKNLQRAVTLQAAYDGWTAIGCNFQKSRNNVVYQTMAIAGTTSQGINTYKCVAEKTGCRSTQDDCHGGGFVGDVCYCHGPSCLDAGGKIEGTDLVRNKIRGDQSGSYKEGVNNSCSMKWGTCRCDRNWSGGLPDRTLYLQSTGF